MKVLVGRLFIKARKKEKIKLYVETFDIEEAKRYARWRTTDIMPNSVMFIHDGTQTFFYSDKLILSDEERWVKFKDTVVYDCGKGEEVLLSDRLLEIEFDEYLRAALCSVYSNSKQKRAVPSSVLREEKIRSVFRKRYKELKAILEELPQGFDKLDTSAVLDELALMYSKIYEMSLDEAKKELRNCAEAAERLLG